MSSSESKPPWLRRRLPPDGNNAAVMEAIKEHSLHTVCVEAHCPNQMECFSRGIATFLLLGPNCTRRCTFCAVKKSRILPPDPDEPGRTAQAVARMGLDFCVLTMVTRDDLADGGADHIVRTVEEIRKICPRTGVELLISDMAGNWEALLSILATRPEVLAHNIETVPRLYPEVRPQADYGRSLELLSRVSGCECPTDTKSGLMLGLGETRDELLNAMDDLRESGCRLLTLGQYLAPSRLHHPIVRYIPPGEFAEYEEEAYARGFSSVASAPYVRSSYRAGEMYRKAQKLIAFSLQPKQP